ncbi:hypothetical protein EFS38_14620 [Dickeya undicola]|uniref:Toxin SymE-like domain-containing protein n=1 Tax=Dickeya undicola TaxID=1577887 RepID=A0ABX9WRK4_9GAMM|nr:hypothetical protein [Dickeya undicola]RNM22155.1 hypothetical protein EFS38_14620 [Dickeya undicola]
MRRGMNRLQRPDAHLRVDIRVMPGCMVITAQNTRELWHCLEGLSIEPFDPDAAANWIRHYPGGLKFAE